MKIVTWNINGIKARLHGLTGWLQRSRPDVVCLQEIKCQDEAFPRLEIEQLGYHLAVCGQKGFNGVALLSRMPLEDVRRGLPGDPNDEHARYIEALVVEGATAVRVGGLYLPNGNPIGTDKFTYKLAWMARLERHAASLLELEEPLVLAGDWNVIPEAADAHDPSLWLNDALFQPETRAAYRRVLSLGFTDAVRACHPGEGHYTFWDYQAGAWQKDNGIRIDHLLLSPQAADRLAAAGIDRMLRAEEKPSDHVPVWIDIDTAR